MTIIKPGNPKQAGKQFTGICPQCECIVLCDGAEVTLLKSKCLKTGSRLAEVMCPEKDCCSNIIVRQLP